MPLVKPTHYSGVELEASIRYLRNVNHPSTGDQKLYSQDFVVFYS